MKTLKKYQCELCGTIYDNEEYALNCERAHCKEAEIVKVSFTECSDYPWKIVVKFEDGRKIAYREMEDKIPEGIS